MFSPKHRRRRTWFPFLFRFAFWTWIAYFALLFLFFQWRLVFSFLLVHLLTVFSSTRLVSKFSRGLLNLMSTFTNFHPHKICVVNYYYFYSSKWSEEKYVFFSLLSFLDLCSRNLRRKFFLPSVNFQFLQRRADDELALDGLKSILFCLIIELH